MFDNILSNAAKYSAGDLTVTLTPDGAVTFANHAPNLSCVQANQLVDRFFTVETARARPGGGAGERRRGPPVPGIREAIEYIRLAGYLVVVVSTRCCEPEGMGAVRRYLRDNEIVVDNVMMEKPPAVCYIDDRAICFDGHPETLLEKIINFKPWNYSREKEEAK